METTSSLGNKSIIIESLKSVGEGEGDTKCCSRGGHHSTKSPRNTHSIMMGLHSFTYNVLGLQRSQNIK